MVSTRAALSLVLVALALHVIVDAEPVGGVSEDLIVPEVLPTREGSTQFPDTKAGLDALVDEVLVEVEGSSEQENSQKEENRNNKASRRSDDDVLVQEEASGEGEGEGEERLTEWSKIPQRNLWAFAAIVSFLIFFTLIFEHGKEHVVEEVKGTPNEPLVMSIFSELTVLGFLALVCFLISKMGIHHLSLMVFGHADVEEDKQKLTEMIEGIHMCIFLVMVLFLLEAMGMMVVANRDGKRWDRLEEAVLTIAQRKELVEEWQDICDNHHPGEWEKWFNLTEKAQKYNQKKNHIRFMLMRQEFINDELDDNNKLARDFDFTLYLRLVMGERLAHCVELPMSQWVALELLTLVMVSTTAWMADGEWLFLLCIWLGWAWLLLLLAHLFLRNQWWILHMLVHSCHGKTILDSDEVKEHEEVEASEARLAESKTVSQGDAITGAAADSTTAKSEAGDGNPSTAGSGEGTGSGTIAEGDTAPLKGVEVGNQRRWIKSQPRYLNQERLDHPIYSFCPSIFFCGSDHEDEDGNTTTGPFWCRQDSCLSTLEEMVPCIEGGEHSPDSMLEKRRFYHLFPYGKHEVSHQLFMLRFLFLGNAVYLSVFIMCMVPMYIDSAFHIGAIIALSVVGLTPGLLIYFVYMYQIIGVSTQVTGVEHFRMRRMIEKVKRTQKEQRCVTMLRMLVALNNLQEGTDEQKSQFGKAKSSNRHRSIVELMTRHQKDKVSKTKIADHLNNHTNIKLDHFADIFETLDKDDDGDITKKEISEMMSKFGVTLKEETFYLMAQADIDTGGNFQHETKDDETIQKEEFLIFLLNMSEQAKHVHASCIVNFVFDLWDKGEDVGDGKGNSKGGDKDQRLSVSELHAGLASLGESFTASDISNIINELDINDDGEFSKHEFTLWVEYHDTTHTFDDGEGGLMDENCGLCDWCGCCRNEGGHDHCPDEQCEADAHQH